MKMRIKDKCSVSILLTLVMLLVGYINCATTVQAAETYGKSYTIANALSDYQYFVQGDLTAGGGGHCQGGVVVGGTLYSDNTIGDAQVAPSYVKNLKKITNFAQGNCMDATAYKANKVTKLYYESLDPAFCSNYSWMLGRLTNNPNYIDINTAFTNFKKESSTMATSGTNSCKSDKDKITINLSNTKDNYVTIPYNTLKSVNKIEFNGVASVQDFVSHKNVISVTGINNDNYTLSTCNMYMNGKPFNNALKDLKGGCNGEMINFEGMKLIWNFPDATGKLTANALSGHLVAPQADVSLTGGNFEGCIIAKCVSKADAEAHYYTYDKPGTTPATIPVPTMTPTTSATTVTVPTIPPTTSATTVTVPTIPPTTCTTTVTVPTTAPTTIANVVTTVPTAAPIGGVTSDKITTVITPTSTPTSTPTPQSESSVAGVSDTIDIADEKTPQDSTENNDRVVASANDKKPDTVVADNAKSPKTGERSPLIIFVIIALASGSGIAIWYVINRKKQINVEQNKNIDQ